MVVRGRKGTGGGMQRGREHPDVKTRPEGALSADQSAEGLEM